MPKNRLEPINCMRVTIERRDPDNADVPYDVTTIVVLTKSRLIANSRHRHTYHHRVKILTKPKGYEGIFENFKYVTRRPLPVDAVDAFCTAMDQSYYRRGHSMHLKKRLPCHRELPKESTGTGPATRSRSHAPTL
jgi:hypothetical protein